MCDRDYWRVRRLKEKTPEELIQLKREADTVKTCIDLALHASDDTQSGVAPSQPRTRYPGS